MVAIAKTVCLVDDDNSVLFTLAKTFEKAGYDVVSTNDSRNVLKLLEESKPDAVVLDLMMPELSGWDVLDEIRHEERFQSTPIILVSSLSGASDRVRGLRAGADDYVSKPFDLDEIVVRTEARICRNTRIGVGIEGRIEAQCIQEMAQNLEGTGKTGELKIDAEDDLGVILVKAGKVVNARWKEYRGKTAVQAILELKDGWFHFNVCDIDEGPERISFIPLLMEQAWVEDELESRKPHWPMPNDGLVSAGELPECPPDLDGFPWDEIFDYVQRHPGITLSTLIKQRFDTPCRCQLVVAWMKSEGQLTWAACPVATSKEAVNGGIHAHLEPTSDPSGPASATTASAALDLTPDEGPSSIDNGEWVDGVAYCQMEPCEESCRVEEILQPMIGSLPARNATVDELVSRQEEERHELIVLSLRHNPDLGVLFVHELRQHRIRSPVLVVCTADVLPNLSLDDLGAVDSLAIHHASEAHVLQTLDLLRRVFLRELALENLSASLEVAQKELLRRRDEVGFLTYSLACREIDEELISERLEERTMEQVNQQLDYSMRQGKPLVGYLVGIDDMKNIKMLCGSAFAAFILVQIAFRLKRAVREADRLWRIGQEGFLILSPYTSTDPVCSYAQRLIGAVSITPLEQEGHAVVPSISVGAAIYHPKMVKANELIELTRTALVTAQHQGRGQVHLN